MNCSYWVLDGLENLWTSIGALSNNPLVDKLKLASDEDDDFIRAMALVEAILQAGQRIKIIRNGQLFAMLNQAFGLEGDIKRQYQISADRTDTDELVVQAGLASVDEYEKQLYQAIRVLAEDLVGVPVPSEFFPTVRNCSSASSGSVCSFLGM